jgi:hypothetical protein
MNDSSLLERPDRVIAKAWADEDFKAALLVDATSALRSQGFEIPEGVTIKVIENTDHVINLVLPKAPDLPLVTEALEGIGGGDLCSCRGCGGCGGCRGCSCGGGCVSCTCVMCTCV